MLIRLRYSYFSYKKSSHKSLWNFYFRLFSRFFFERFTSSKLYLPIVAIQFKTVSEIDFLKGFVPFKLCAAKNPPYIVFLYFSIPFYILHNLDFISQPFYQLWCIPNTIFMTIFSEIIFNISLALIYSFPTNRAVVRSFSWYII